MYTNANCISNKKTELQARIQEKLPHIIGVTEVWAKDQFYIDGYHPAVHKHRADNQVGGGVLLLVQDTLEVQECDELNAFEFQDSVWCMVFLQDKHEKVLVGVCYRSPSSNESNNSKLIELMNIAVKKQATSFLLMGDFNYNKINWETGVVSAGEGSPSSMFYQSVQDCFLCQHVHVPTRYRDGCSPSNLDLVFTKRECDIENLTVCDPLGKSDHVVLTWELILKNRVHWNTDNTRYNFYRADYMGMQNFLAMQNWNEMESMDIESAWEYFKHVVHLATAKYVPKCTRKRSGPQIAPWWNSVTERAVRAKYKAWKLYSTSKKSEDFKAYTIQRNKSLRTLRKARQKYEDGLIGRVKTDPKKLYKYIRRQQKVKAMVGNLEVDDGVVTNSDKETADAFQEFFQSVFVKEGDMAIPDFPDKIGEGHPLSDISFTHNDILSELETLNEDKSTGLDNISTRVLKNCAHQLAQPLKTIFAKSMEERKLPSDWKKARITPIFKKGKKRDVSNYRPVSITSQTCKVMERIIRKKLMTHMEENNLMSPCQHGFISKRSCLTNLLESLEDWTDIIDKGHALDIIFLDFSKAFDKVPPKRLLRKLFAMAFRVMYMDGLRIF